MPNRKTFDEKEKYDHSSHSIAHRQAGDLRPDVNVDVDAGNDFESAATETHSREAVNQDAREAVNQDAAKVRRKQRSRRTG
jgi:hypothetical protein